MPVTMGGGYGGRGGLRLGLGLGTGLVQAQGGGSSAPVLGNITASPNTETVDAAYSGTSSGRTAGSTLSLTGTGAAGLSINSSTGAITGTPTASGPVNIVETLAGATGSPKTSSGVITVSYDANILYLDRYATNPNSGLLSDRVPLVTGDAAFPNHYPSSDGNIAPLMRVASGVMGQSATGTGAGYDNQLLPENPGMVSCDFIWGNGAQPAVMGIYPYPGSLAPTPNPAALKLIHLFTTTTSLSPQLGKYDYFPTGAANYPFALPSPASPFTLTVGQKYTLRAKFQGSWVFMELLNSSGTVIAKAQAFDSLVPQLMGRGVFLAETFDTAMTYSEEKAMRISPFTVPTINPAINSYFPTGLDGLVGSMYAGGGVSWTSANRVTITANATLGSGAAIPIGPIAVNDRVRVTVDVVSVGANGFVVAIAPTSPGAPISAITPFFSAPGRASVELVATGANADSSLVIGGNGVGATTAVIQSDFTLVNPPALI